MAVQVRAPLRLRAGRQQPAQHPLRHGFDETVRADVPELPFEDESFDVVAAGQCLEHVPDPYGVVAEACRVLRPGGTLIIDTIADTKLARLVSITLGENLPLPGRPPRGTHDHRLEWAGRVNTGHGAPGCGGTLGGGVRRAAPPPGTGPGPGR
ncbi:class I SAM-dependent methyltransferase [Streptomyces sp. H27-H1]|nr:class I SAM-dependent methyltransferase [Streptomyces sp. H27-H1]